MWHSFQPQHPLKLQNPKITSRLSHFQTSQLLEGKKRICFAPLPGTMLPVQCYSEKINICWKVQIDERNLVSVTASHVK